jgi:hypothetical protein
MAGLAATAARIPRRITNERVGYFFWEAPPERRGVRSTVMSLVIRCGTPDCDWGHRVSDVVDNEQLQLCCSEFRKHCIQRHDLQEWEIPTSHMHFDLEHWLLTLIKG